jgi:NADPH:quinone reductase-like Zn-dependent oxidoreductase/NAD(P)-dependent dehydrogenase (short-subunit alcohol dehydrogenase family)/SAM-dependent methyltransferase
MLAVGIGEDEIAQYIHQTRTGIVSVACVNSPESTTISGDETAIDELKDIFDGLSIFNRKLKVDTAYHSHHMKKVAMEYLGSLQGITPSSPRGEIKFYSSVSADRKSSDFGPSYWVENLISKVRFSDSLQKLWTTELASPQHATSNPANLLIEIGPHSALSGPIRQTMMQLNLQELKYSYLSTLVRNQSSVRTILELAGKVFDYGYPVDLKAAALIDGSKEPQRTISDLVPYSWDHSNTYWHESRLSRDHRLRAFPYHDLLGLLVVGSPVNEPVWRNHISIETLPWLQDHVVDGFTIFPGSGYLCMAVEAVCQITKIRQVPGLISRFIIRDVMFSKAIIVPEQGPDGLTPEVEIQLTMKPVKNVTDRSTGDFFRISSIHNGVWSEHCSGTILVEMASKIDEVEGSREEDLAIAAHIQEFQSMKQACNTELNLQELYDNLKANGNVYGPSFALINEAHIANCQGIAKVIIPDIAACMPLGFMQPHIIHPATLDAINQIAIPLYKRHCNSGPVMPISMEEISIAADIVNKPGAELSVALEITPEDSRSALLDLVVFQAKSDSTVTPVLTIVRGQLRGIGEANISDESSPFHRKMSYRMKWAADVEYVTPELLTTAVSDLREANYSKEQAVVSQKMSVVDELALHERVAGLYIRFALQKIAQGGSTSEITKNHLIKLFSWMTSYNNSEANQELIKGMTAAEEDACLLAGKEAGVEGEMLSRIGEHLPSIFMGALDPLALMLEDDLLYRFYSQGLLVTNYQQMIDYLELLTFKNRHMTIIEVGAGTGCTTLPLIQSLNRSDGLLFSRYDYTDISAEFFEGAKTLLQQWAGSINFKTLDISRDPVEQGFVAGSYDLVIASNVLHATSSMDVTIANVRKLLKPGGRLALIELNRLTAAINIIFGTLPGWWAPEDGRVDSPLLSIGQWDSILSRNGFNGVEFSTPDHKGPTQRSSFIASKAIGQSQDSVENIGTIELLCESSVLQGFAWKLSQHFESRGLRTSAASWPSHHIPSSSIYVVLDDVDQPLLVDPSPERYEQIRKLLITAKSVLWISAREGPSPLEKFAGNEGLVVGVARVIRRENEGMKFITFDVQQNLKDLQNYDHLLQTISGVFSSTFCPSSESQKSNEMEYAYGHGRLHIPRVITDVAFNEWVTRAVGTPDVEVGLYHQPQRPLKLQVESPGLLSSMRFIDNATGTTQIPLAPDEVQIEARAYGVNFKDVFIAMGQMPPSMKMTGECSGLVTAVGLEFQSRFKVGDRVCAVVAEPFSSLARVKGYFAYHLPDSMTFTVGASVPIVFLTAYHCLVEIARIRKGQTVLIHAASGGVGQAALMLAQHAGAEIFATVGSAAKRQLLIDKFKLPESHIFSTRSRTFKKGVFRLTKNKGVDIVLNSLSGEMLNDSWACIAPLGTFIEIGKADIIKRGQLSMVPFDRHVSFAAVDLTVLLALKPDEMQERFSKIMSMFEAGFLRPVEPVTAMEMTDIQDAFRLIQSRKHTGKVVLEANEKTMVKVISARPPPIQLDEQGTYIVAGGLGDLGRRICRLLAAKGAKSIVTLSRRHLDPQQKKLFEDDLLTLGAKIHMVACDITDSALLNEVASRIRDSLPVVKGIIHAGMVLRDHPMEQMDLEDYNIALAPKVHGTRNLHNAFGNASLGFFIMLSSITCILGKTGQANYSAGNSFQDAFAHAQSQANPHTRYISLNLGAIDGSEAITSLPIRQQELMRQGAILMQFDELFKLLEYSMSPQAQRDGLVQSIHGFDHQSMEAVQDSFALTNPLFNQLPVATQGETVGGTNTESINVEKCIQNASTLAEAEGHIIRAIAERFALFSATPVDEINMELSLQEFGLE